MVDALFLLSLLFFFLFYGFFIGVSFKSSSCPDLCVPLGYVFLYFESRDLFA